MKISFSFILLFLTFFIKAQISPKLFEPNTISNGGVFGLTISPDSKTALWVLSKGKRDTLTIMESVKENGKWTQPRVASFSSAHGEWKDIDPIFSPDGKTVLFQSNRNTNRTSDRKDFDIWAVKLSNKGWSQPYRLEGNINSDASESYASMTKDGTIYFMKENDNKTGLSDIYYSILKDGKYQEPQNMGFPINTNERESNPYISPDGKYIIYFSSDKSGFGEVDLYISFKRKDGWTTPKNLGGTINSKISEFCPFVHQKEKRLYFSRQEKEGDRFKENLYFIEFYSNKYK
ncbi:TolB family protein [Flavobacterium sp. RS13.1]|uniref:TolB family protein n=1 Tax=Flavobacterium sp. RS13.1 TaxID=3400345 RepID=UPI003AAF8782